MLVLSRKTGEAVLIGDYVVRVCKIGPNNVRLGFEAPKEVNIARAELVKIPRVATINGAPAAFLAEAPPAA